MKYLLIACITVLSLVPATAQAQCKVNDPTGGTPLNVRSRPNGPILGALSNGTPVLASALVVDIRERNWAKIVYIKG